MNTIYLVRHGENPANITKEFSHRKVDYPLTEKGVLQSVQTAEYFRGMPVDEVYASPLKRAIQTAQIIAAPHDLPVVEMEEFREVDSGTLEDAPPSDENWRIYMAVIRDWFAGKPESRFPGGESYYDVAERALLGIGEIVRGKDGKHIVVVGHGGIFTVAVTALCRGSDLSQLKGSPYQNCAITRIEAGYNGESLKGALLEWNYSAHLSGEAAELVPAVPEALARNEGSTE